MTLLAHRRCQHHADREAVARCPECSGFFCRECISEYDDRVLCSTCLAKQKAPSAPPARRWTGVILLVQSMVAVMLIWFFFFLIGRTLLAIPTSFHEGRIWQMEEAE